jgi:uncharacterized phiE125 gp8 family phage protein
MNLVLQTPPASEPITLAAFKAHVRVDEDAEDTLLTSYLLAARVHVEQLTSWALLDQTWDLFLDRFPAGDRAIELRRKPVSAVTSVTYVDPDGASQTLDPARWRLDAASHIPRLVPAWGETWPTHRCDVNAVRVRFKAGAADAASITRPNLVHAVLLLAAHWYEVRTPVNVGNIVTPVPWTVSALINPHRLSLL